MKELIILTAIVALFGCDSIKVHLDEQIKDCRGVALAIAKSPSTVEFVDSHTNKTSRMKTAYVDFDSQNSFGAIVRTELQCKYPAKEVSGYESLADTVFINGVEADAITMVEIASARLEKTMRKYQ